MTNAQITDLLCTMGVTHCDHCCRREFGKELGCKGYLYFLYIEFNDKSLLTIIDFKLIVWKIWALYVNKNKLQTVYPYKTKKKN